MHFLFKALFSISFILICSCNANNKNDFELFCDFITEMEQTEKFTPYNIITNYEKIYGHLNNSDYGQDLRNTLSSLTVAIPKERYNNFVKISKLVVKKQWSCPPLQRFYSTHDDVP